MQRDVEVNATKRASICGEAASSTGDRKGIEAEQGSSTPHARMNIA
jgi:hypothetical protein